MAPTKSDEVLQNDYLLRNILEQLSDDLWSGPDRVRLHRTLLHACSLVNRKFSAEANRILYRQISFIDISSCQTLAWTLLSYYRTITAKPIYGTYCIKFFIRDSGSLGRAIFADLIPFLPNLQRLAIPSADQYTLAKVFNICPELEVLRFSPQSNDDVDTTYFHTLVLRPAATLKTLCLVKTCFDAYVNRLFEYCPSLQLVRLEQCKFTHPFKAPAPQGFERLRRLEVIDCTCNGFDDFLVSLVQSLEDLCELELQGKGILSEPILDAVTQNVGPTLRKVQLSRISRISDRGLEHLILAACSLEQLRVRSCKTDESLFDRIATSGFANPFMTHFEFRGPVSLSLASVVAITVVFPNLQSLEVTVQRTKPANLPIGITRLARLHTLRVEYLSTGPEDSDQDRAGIKVDLQRLFGAMPSLVRVEWNKLLVERRMG
ncbi:hypothetical protein BC936DRAFT_138725 [Jimgerdemannia flammicorona]|uniref:Uncharacterized protein n=2 Tax=Jimgerdemannia flammicorona TaxID=994334 RepID=A0A433QCE5_9FUNG|nr:hypothetical protein BC936DRAFT_138725 [Jimgerdemannia flammicorona]RUS27455.1 hypothetical protein BC938DRAFT_483224 [Jimgerdemannia flammicorona]